MAPVATWGRIVRRHAHELLVSQETKHRIKLLDTMASGDVAGGTARILLSTKRGHRSAIFKQTLARTFRGFSGTDFDRRGATTDEAACHHRKNSRETNV